MKKYESQIQKNPEIFAQMEIAKAVFELTPKFEKFAEMLLEKNYAEKAEVSLRPYNSGYELMVDININFEKWDFLKGVKGYETLDQFHSVYLYPGSFFNSAWKEECGAELCGRSMEQGRDGISVRVKSNEDVIGTVKYWKKVTADRIDQLTGIIKSWEA